MIAAGPDLERFLFKHGLSNCLKHLKHIKVTTFDTLKSLSANDLKAIGFKTEVRKRLQRALKGGKPEFGLDGQQELIVMADEEEEAALEGLRHSGRSPAKKNKRANVAVQRSTESAAAICCVDEQMQVLFRVMCEVAILCMAVVKCTLWL